MSESSKSIAVPRELLEASIELLRKMLANWDAMDVTDYRKLCELIERLKRVTDTQDALLLSPESAMYKVGGSNSAEPH